MNKILKSMGCILFLFTWIVLPVKASQRGSITIELQDSIDDLSKDKVEFEWIQIATCKDGYYVLNDDFTELNVNFNEEMKADELEKIQNKIEKMNIEEMNKIQTDKTGICTISNIEEGIYFFHPTDIHEYENMTSMIVSVPEWNEDILNYDVHVYPKHSPFNKLILNKIDEDTKKEIKDKVEFTMYDDSNCTKKIKTFSGIGSLPILARYEKVYIKETKAPNGYNLSSRVICLEVKDNKMFVDGKEQDSGTILHFKNKKIKVPTGIHSEVGMYILIGVISSIGIFYVFRKA